MYISGILKLEFLTAVLLNIKLFGVVGLCHLLNRNKHFAKSCHLLFLQEEALQKEQGLRNE